MVIEPEKREVLERLIRRAGAKILEFWSPKGEKSSALSYALNTKDDGSPVTSADLASNAILIDGIRSVWPNDGIISEEIPDRSDLGAKERVWIIDPLDGTRSFVEGRGDFSILVGLAIQGKVKFGMMYFPVLDQLACAESGQGAIVNGQTGAISEHSEFAPRSVYYRNFNPAPGEHLYDRYMDSGMAFFALSTGQLDGIIIKMTSHKEWDIAAPIAIVEESGGIVTDERGNSISFGADPLKVKYVVASNTKLHRKLLSLIT